MRTALDTNVISRLWSSAESRPGLSSLLGKWRAEGGLVIAGAVYTELLAYPGIKRAQVDAFLSDVGIELDCDLGRDIWTLAGEVFAAYAARRLRSGGGEAKRLLTDFIIGAHAQIAADRLATLNPSRYRAAFPTLTLIPDC